MNPDEQQLVLLAQRGDQPAFGALVDGYQGLVFAVALNVTGNWSDSEDVVQETFLRAWLKLRSLAEPAAFASWLCTIARRAALDLLRRRRIPTLDIDTELARQVESHDETPAEAFARRQLNELLWAEVAELPSRSREAILLFYMEGYSLRRAAAFLEISESAFKARLDYGRRLLRAGMERRLEEKLLPRRAGDRRRAAILAALPVSALPVDMAASAPLTPATTAGSMALAAGGSLLPWVAILLAGLFLSGLALQVRFAGKGSSDPAAKVAQDGSVNAIATSTASLLGPNKKASLPASGLQNTTIAGLVVDLQYQRPIAGVTVTLRNHALDLTTSTDHQGNFSFAVAAPGAFQVALAPDQELMRTAFEPDKGTFSPVHVQVANRDVTGIVFHLVPRRWMQGKVVEAGTGRPVPGVRLRRFDDGAGWMAFRTGIATDAASTRTNEQGRFRLPRPRETPDGAGVNFSILAEAEGYFSMLFSEAMLLGGGIQSDRLIVTMTPRTGASLAGRLVDGSGRPWRFRPLLAAYVEQGLQSSQPRLDFHRLIHTDADGRFNLENVPAGHTIRLNYEWWRLDPNTFQSMGNREVTVDLGARMDMGDILIEGPGAPGTLAGILLDASGKPLAHRCVYAGHESSTPDIPILVAATVTNAEGRWRIADVPDHRPLAFFADRDDGIAIRNIKKILLKSPHAMLPPAEEIVLRLPSDIQTTDNSQPAGEANGFLPATGQVIDALTGRPIPAFELTATPQEQRRPLDRQAFSKTIFHPDGVFDLPIPDLAPGVSHLFLHFNAAGYEETSLAYRRFDTSKPARIPMKPYSGRFLRGTILSAQGQPVHGATISLPAWNRHAAYSRADGSFEFPVPFQLNADHAQVLQLYVEHPDHASGGASSKFDPAGDALIAPVEIRLPPASAVMGVVVDAAMRPVVGQSVEVVRLSDTPPTNRVSSAFAPLVSFKAITDDQGMFRMDRIPPGRYQAATGDIRKSGYFARNFKLSADRVADISFGTGTGTLRGVLYNASGEILDDFGVGLDRATGGSATDDRFYAQLIARNGHFGFSGLDPGNYTLEAFNLSVSVTIHPGEVVVQNLIRQ